ncbi:MAG: Hpt domain-containing protein [Cellvibrionaceae bacterium]|nr:Hpt domain-containing protein [Cellvibrionaceae bacterium]
MEAVLNEHLLNELRDLMGEDFNLLIDTYRSDSDYRLKKIQESIAASEYSDVVSAAHSLKGSSANIGALNMEELCHQLVLAGRDGDQSSMSYLLPKLKTEFEHIRAYFSDIPSQ